MIRLLTSIFCAIAGLILAGLVIQAISVVGTDDVTETEPVKLSTGAYALVLNESIVPYENTTATITAQSKNGPIFLGTASGVDTDNYLKGVAHEQITDVTFGGKLAHRTIPGKPAPQVNAESRDWWLSKKTGTSVSETFDLDAQPRVVVIAPTGDNQNLDGVTVQMTMAVKGVLGLSLVGLAAALILLATAVYFFWRWWESRLIPPKKRTLSSEDKKHRRLRMRKRYKENSDPNLAGDTDDGASDHLDEEAAVAGDEADDHPADAEGVDSAGINDDSSSDSGAGGGRGSGPGDGTSGGASGGTSGGAVSVAPMTRRERRLAEQSGTAGKSRLQRKLAPFAVGSALAVALSGCGVLPVAQPHRPDLTPYERPALRKGEAGEFLASYTEQLDKTLAADQSELDTIQTGPLLDRTRAEVLIAKAQKKTLSAVDFSEIVAGGPTFKEYPLWFMAFGTPKSGGDDVQAMLATRESAADNWKVAQSVYIPKDRVPVLLADSHGAVAEPAADYTKTIESSAQALSDYLAQDKKPDENALTLTGDGFGDYRGYITKLGNKDSGFENVKVDCSPYEEVPLKSMALKTETGDVSFGEIRCTFVVKAPKDYSLDMGTEVNAVMSTDNKGNEISVETSHPYLLLTEDGKTSAISAGWNILRSSTKKV